MVETITSVTLQEYLLVVESEGENLRSAISVYTRNKDGPKVQQLRQLEQRWNRLWLRCAEWKCLLEVAISQHGQKVTLAVFFTVANLIFLIELVIQFRLSL